MDINIFSCNTNKSVEGNRSGGFGGGKFGGWVMDGKKLHFTIYSFVLKFSPNFQNYHTIKFTHFFLILL